MDRIDLPANQVPAGLAILLQASGFAKATGSNPWDFAVERSIFDDAGVSPNQLRRLLADQFVEHGLELAPSDNERRPVRTTKSFRFHEDSCFILTTAGLEYARSICVDSFHEEPGRQKLDQPDAGGKMTPSKPHWDGNTRRLSCQGVSWIELVRAAENMETVLEAFEQAGWVPQIHDPFPADKPGNRKRRLHNTINALNRCQRVPRIHFASADGGRAIRCTIIPMSRPDEATPSSPSPVVRTKGRRKPGRSPKRAQQKARPKRR